MNLEAIAALAAELLRLLKADRETDVYDGAAAKRQEEVMRELGRLLEEDGYGMAL